MKIIPVNRKSQIANRKWVHAFTIVELLVVIAIIGILAAMLLPVLSAAQKHASMTKAKLEVNQIGNSIQQYESQYSRLPVSTAVQHSGWTNVTYGGVYSNISGTIWPASPISPTYIVSNTDVIAILMNYTNYPNSTTWTVNTNYQKNPQQTIFLSATLSGNTSSPGVGTDLQYRDPWGNPYIISLDLNEDEKCEDAFYSEASVSSSTGKPGGSGLNGLSYQSSDGNYAFHGNYMVWSMGPYGPFNHAPTQFTYADTPPPSGAACWDLDPANKYHIFSWQQ